MKTAVTDKVVNRRNLNLYALFAFIVVVLLHMFVIKQPTVYTEMLWKTGMILGLAALYVYERIRTAKNRSLSAIAEAVAVGIYEPEDERDVEIKLASAMNAFTITQFICWIAFVYYFIALPGASYFVHPTAMLALGLSVVGRIVFSRTMRKKGVEFDFDRLKKKIS